MSPTRLTRISSPNSGSGKSSPHASPSATRPPSPPSLAICSSSPSLSKSVMASMGVGLKSRIPPPPSSAFASHTSTASAPAGAASGSIGGHTFKTISAGTFRHNNPFAQRLQAQAAIGAGARVVEGLPGGNRVLDGGGDAPRTPTSGRMGGGTLPLTIVGKSTGSPSALASGGRVPSPSSNSRGASSLSPPVNKGHERRVSHSPSNHVDVYGGLEEGRDDATHASASGRSASPSSARKGKSSPSLGISGGSIPRRAPSPTPTKDTPHSRDTLSPRDARAMSPRTTGGVAAPGGGKKKPMGVHRKTVPTLSPDTAHAATLPRARSPSSAGTTARKASGPGATLSPPTLVFPVAQPHGSVRAPGGKSMLRQPSVPLLRGGGGGLKGDGRRRSSSVSSTREKDLCEPGKSGRDGMSRGLGLAPALPIFGRKARPSLPTTTLGAAGADCAARSDASPGSTGSSSPVHQDVPAHIRARLDILGRLADVLGIDRADVGRKIDVPALLARVDRAWDRYSTMCGEVNGAEYATPGKSGEVSQMGVEDAGIPLTPAYTLSVGGSNPAAEGHAADVVLAGSGDGAAVSLLSPDAPLVIDPTSTSTSHSSQLEGHGPVSSQGQDHLGELGSVADGRFGASPSLSFSLAAFGLAVDGWCVREQRDDGVAVCDAKGKEKDKEKGRGVFGKFRYKARKSEGKGGVTDARGADRLGSWDVPAFGRCLADLPADAWCLTRIDKVPHHLPLAAYLCIEDIWKRGMAQPGIFRLSGTETQVDRLFSLFNTAPFYGQGSALHDSSPYTTAHLLKRFLRDLPEPLLDESLLSALWDWCAAPDLPSGIIDSAHIRPAHPRRITSAVLLLRLLAPQHRSLLVYLLAFIAHLAHPAHAGKNRLTLDSIAIIFGPAMFAPRGAGVPGVGAGSGGEKGDVGRVSALVEMSQKCLAWLVKYWPVIAGELGEGEGWGTLVREQERKKEEGEVLGLGLLSPFESTRGLDMVAGMGLGDGARAKMSLDIPRSKMSSSTSSLSSSLSLSSFTLGMSSSTSLSHGLGVDKIGHSKTEATARKTPGLSSSMSKASLSAPGSTGTGGILRSALSNMSLASAFKEDEGLGVKVPKRSASFTSLSTLVRKGMGMGSKEDKRGKIVHPHLSPLSPTDSLFPLTPADSPDPSFPHTHHASYNPRPSVSFEDGPRKSSDLSRPSSLFSSSGLNAQVTTVLGSLQDLLVSKDRQIERDARELAILRHTLLEMDAKLTRARNAPAGSEHQAPMQRPTPPSPEITITASPSSSLGSESDGLVSDLRAQLHTTLEALTQARETTRAKDTQLVELHAVLARARAERLAEANRADELLRVEAAKKKGLREERDLARVRLEKVKKELFSVA